MCCYFSLDLDLYMIDFLKHSLPRGQRSCNRGEGRVFGSGTWNEDRPSKMKGTACVLFCHTVGYLPCRYRNVDVNFAVTSAIVCLVMDYLVTTLPGCRLRLQAFLLRDSVHTGHFLLQKHIDECSDVIHVATLMVILLSIHFLPPFVILFMK